MKIALSSNMPKRVAIARDAINAHFAGLAAVEAHRDQAHRDKRAVAQAVLDGQSTGLLGVFGIGGRRTSLPDDHPFAVEASMRGLPPVELARDVVAKPDNFATRELQRQRLLLAVEKANTPAEIDALLASLRP